MFINPFYDRKDELNKHYYRGYANSYRIFFPINIIRCYFRSRPHKYLWICFLKRRHRGRNIFQMYIFTDLQRERERDRINLQERRKIHSYQCRNINLLIMQRAIGYTVKNIEYKSFIKFHIIFIRSKLKTIGRDNLSFEALVTSPSTKISINRPIELYSE